MNRSKTTYAKVGKRISELVRFSWWLGQGWADTYCEACWPFTELIQSSCWYAETGVGGSIDSTYSIVITFS